MAHSSRNTAYNTSDDIVMDDMKALDEALPAKHGSESTSSPSAIAQDDQTMDDNPGAGGVPLPPTTSSSTPPPDTIRGPTANEPITSGAAHERIQQPASDSPLTDPLFATVGDQNVMPGFQEGIYEALYSGMVVPLKDIGYPDEANEHPELAGDITAAYLKHATFTVKVWVNYDAAEEIFFQGNRATDCGKLYLPSDIIGALKESDPDAWKFHHIRFEVGTAWRTLARLRLEVKQGEDGCHIEVGGRWVSREAGVLSDACRHFVHECCEEIRAMSIPKDQDGMTYKDLETYAAFFKREPEGRLRARKSEWEQPLYGFGEWAGMEEPSSPVLGFGIPRTIDRGKWVERWGSGGLKGGGS